MINISLPNALRIWAELEAAYYGNNGYGGDTAEIYAHRVLNFSNLARLAQCISSSGLGREALVEEATECSEALAEIIKLFKDVHPDCDITVDGTTPKKALSQPLTHRCHVTITTNDPQVTRMRQAARPGREV